MVFPSTMPIRLAGPVLAVLLSFAGWPAAAQMVPGLIGPGESSGAAESPGLAAEPLTRQAIRDVLSGLSDGEVRELLLQELDHKVAAREAVLAEAEKRSLGAVLADWGTKLGRVWANSLATTPAMPAVLAAAFDGFQASRGDASLWRFAGTLVLALLAGLGAALLARRLAARPQARLYTLGADRLWSRIGIITGRLLLQGIQLIAFVIASFLVDAVVNRGAPADSGVVRDVVRAIGWTWFAVMAARFVLSPSRPHLRLCAADDETARFLTWRIGLIFGWSAGAIRLLGWVDEFGLPHGGPAVGFWLSVVFHGLMALTIWQARSGITRMVVGDGDSGPAWHRFAALWPMIAIGFVAVQWLVVELYTATENLANLSITALNVTVALALALPLVELLVRSLVEAIWPDDPAQEAALRAAHRETQLGLVRCGRTLAVVLLIIVLARLWGLDLRDLASQGVGAQLAGALLEVFLIGIVAYGLWELLEIMASRQVAIERAALGLDETDEGQFDGEGGQGGSRLGTIMPLVRRTGQVIILSLAVLAMLGQIGVNVTPLLAGAGIVGVAVGFGAQTLVKDIISGVFFLIDDAFRKGEYIDIGTVKGTVEKISIRSMQLRHHNGPLNTIPFGEIRHLTNFSRDWVLMKLPLRVTYDTDVEKLRKLVKKLGQQMLEDPELGPKFIQPLKSQGVVQMEDSAMIVRVKFMTRPGDQWVLRNKVFTRIRELFEREGIKFAHREVTVRVADSESDRPMNEERREAVLTGAARAVIETPQDARPGAAPRGDR